LLPPEQIWLGDFRADQNAVNGFPSISTEMRSLASDLYLGKSGQSQAVKRDPGGSDEVVEL